MAEGYPWQHDDAGTDHSTDTDGQCRERAQVFGEFLVICTHTNPIGPVGGFQPGLDEEWTGSPYDDE